MNTYRKIISVAAVLLLLAGCAEKEYKLVDALAQIGGEPQQAAQAAEKPGKAAAEPVKSGALKAEPEKKELDWKLVLVNASHPIGDDFKVELKDIGGGQSVDKRIADALLKMIKDAKKDGVSLIVCSGYRSIEKQTKLYENKVKQYIDKGKALDEAKACAATIVAPPKTSEHHTGLAVDIYTTGYKQLSDGFEKTKAFKWLDKNAHKYGFILRYPKDKTEITGIIYEPWHFRFVGVENAENIKQLGVCLEEYVEILQSDRLEAMKGAALH